MNIFKKSLFTYLLTVLFIASSFFNICKPANAIVAFDRRKRTAFYPFAEMAFQHLKNNSPAFRSLTIEKIETPDDLTRQKYDFLFYFITCTTNRLQLKQKEKLINLIPHANQIILVDVRNDRYFETKQEKVSKEDIEYPALQKPAELFHFCCCEKTWQNNQRNEETLERFNNFIQNNLPGEEEETEGEEVDIMEGLRRIKDRTLKAEARVKKLTKENETLYEIIENYKGRMEEMAKRIEQLERQQMMINFKPLE